MIEKGLITTSSRARQRVGSSVVLPQPPPAAGPGLWRLRRRCRTTPHDSADHGADRRYRFQPSRLFWGKPLIAAAHGAAWNRDLTRLTDGSFAAFRAAGGIALAAGLVILAVLRSPRTLPADTATTSTGNQEPAAAGRLHRPGSFYQVPGRGIAAKIFPLPDCRRILRRHSARKRTPYKDLRDSTPEPHTCPSYGRQLVFAYTPSPYLFRFGICCICQIPPAEGDVAVRYCYASAV